MFAAEDSDDSCSTPLDTIRIEGLDIGEGCNAECQKWSVFRYKDGYSLFYKDGKIIEFTALKDLLHFLD